MNGQASIEQNLTKWRVPERHHPRPRSFLRLQGNQAEGVVGEMHRDVESDDDTSDRADPSESSRRDQTK